MRLIILSVAFAFALAGCGGSSPSAPPVVPQDHVDAHVDHAEHEDAEHHHHHEPARGGTLVELGDHAGNIEFVLDATTGKLAAYCSDAHAENPVRLTHASLALKIVPAPGAAPISVELVASANPLTGETVGDTSQFEAVVAPLKGATAFEAIVEPFEYRGVQIASTPFKYSASTPT